MGCVTVVVYFFEFSATNRGDGGCDPCLDLLCGVAAPDVGFDCVVGVLTGLFSINISCFGSSSSAFSGGTYTNSSSNRNL